MHLQVDCIWDGRDVDGQLVGRGDPKTRNRTPTPHELGRIKVLAWCVMAMMAQT